MKSVPSAFRSCRSSISIRLMPAYGAGVAKGLGLGIEKVLTSRPSAAAALNKRNQHGEAGKIPASLPCFD